MDRDKIDWSDLIKYPESAVRCSCGQVFRSHARTVNSKDPASPGWQIVSRKPCPACAGASPIRQVSSDPEIWGVSGPDVGSFKK